MPNHITNIVSIHGMVADVEAAVAKIATTDGGIDFNLAVPMPPSLNIQAGSDTDTGVWLLSGKSDMGDGFEVRRASHLARVVVGSKSRAELLAILTTENAEVIRLGRAWLDNMAKYGHGTWYEWSCEHWGTKWNAYSVSPSRIVNLGRNRRVWLRFETAWAPPSPVLAAVSKVANVTVKNRWKDEGGPSGVDVFVGGEVKS